MASGLDDTLGALFIAMALGLFFHGVTLSQAWYFFSAQGRQFQDTLPLRGLVAVVVALDFVHTVCTTHWIYTICVIDFGDVAAMAILPPSYLGLAYPTGFVTLLVQGFYVWRIWKLADKQWYMPAFIMVCACVQEAIQLYSMSIIGKNPNSTQFTGSLTVIVIVVNGIAAGIDVLIASSVIYLLSRKRSNIARTNNILRTISIYAVTTGCMTGCCAIMVLVSAVALPTTQYVLLFYVLLTRMYANSLLATLNVRDAIRQGNSAGVVISSSQMHSRHRAPVDPNADSSYHLEDMKHGESASGTTHQSIAIKVDRTTDLDSF